MTIERDSVHFGILERPWTMPRPVRGIAGAALDLPEPFVAQGLAVCAALGKDGGQARRRTPRVEGPGHGETDAP